MMARKSQGSPRQRRMSKVLLPMLLLTAIEPLPCRETIRLEMTSGMEVPTARKLRGRKHFSQSIFLRLAGNNKIPQAHDRIWDAQRVSDDRDHPRQHVGDAADPGHAHDEGEGVELDALAETGVGNGEEEEQVDGEGHQPPELRCNTDNCVTSCNTHVWKRHMTRE